MRPETRHEPRPAAPDPGVVAWRAGRLRAAGFPGGVGAGLAADEAADVHALIELVDRGCPPELAARILAPLEGERGR